MMVVTKENFVDYLRTQAVEVPDDTLAIATKQQWDHKLMIGIVKSLEGLQAITTTQVKQQAWTLTLEGEKLLESGSPECKVALLIKSKPGITQPALIQELGKDIVSFGFGAAMKNKWIATRQEWKAVDGATSDNEGFGKIIAFLKNAATKADALEKTGVDGKAFDDASKAKLIAKAGEATFTLEASADIKDVVKEQLAQVKNGSLTDTKIIDALKKRKLVSLESATGYKITKDVDFVAKVSAGKAVNALTEADVQSGEWKTKTFKPINWSAMGSVLPAGQLHPLLKMREHYRRTFFQMGFQEMPTNRFVESSFWNFDTLFQPQQHPARDAHDTFFLESPASANPAKIPSEYLELVRKTHEEGGFGSIGWRYTWSKEESLKNIMRTHTTAVSARMLYECAQKIKTQKGKEWKPVKYFSVDRVFRNETVDATHLAEFHQAEGFVADKGLTLGNLIGLFKEFFAHLGFHPDSLKFKPAYNPYTEPSMEIFGYHPGLGKLIEIGNSGIFRPEMLRPMGVPEDVKVIAWGLSLERPTMIQYGTNNIRDVFSEKLDVAQRLRKNPVCWLRQVDYEQDESSETQASNRV